MAFAIGKFNTWSNFASSAVIIHEWHWELTHMYTKKQTGIMCLRILKIFSLFRMDFPPLYSEINNDVCIGHP